MAMIWIDDASSNDVCTFCLSRNLDRGPVIFLGSLLESIGGRRVGLDWKTGMLCGRNNRIEYPSLFGGGTVKRSMSLASLTIVLGIRMVYRVFCFWTKKISRNLISKVTFQYANTRGTVRTDPAKYRFISVKPHEFRSKES
jgi:hypothetical protein